MGKSWSFEVDNALFRGEISPALTTPIIWIYRTPIKAAYKLLQKDSR